MKRNNCFLYMILFTCVLLSCNPGNFRRDKLHFNENNESVKDAILKVIPLLNKLQNSLDVSKGYDFRNDSFYVNNQLITDTNIDSAEQLSKLEKTEKKELLRVIKFLKGNELTSGSYDSYLSLWLFEYRYLPEGASSDSRVIAVLNNADLSRNKSRIILLDHWQNLYLLKFKLSYCFLPNLGVSRVEAYPL